MKKKIGLLLILAGLFQAGMSQNPIKTPSKEVLFKTPDYWKEQHDNKLKAAPEKIKMLIEQQNAEFEKSSKSLRFGYTDVYHTPIASLTGFMYEAKEDVPLDLCLFEDPPPPMCLTITETASDRKLDMRDYGVITGIRWQDNCGGCWGFASVAALETSVLMKNGGDATMLNISVAQLLACCATYPGRCDGGRHSDALNYMKENFMATETELGFAYPAINSLACNDFVAAGNLYKARAGGWVSGSLLLNPSVDQIKQSICRYGSVVAGMHATDNFIRYASGVYDLNDNPTLFSNHVIQIIGWDDDQQAWLIKNSWGSSWGIGGFGWVRYGTNVIGSFATWLEAQVNSTNPCVSVTNPPDFAMNTSDVNPSYEALLGRFPFPQTQRLQSVQSNLSLDVDDPIFNTPDKGRKVQQWTSHTQIPLGSDGKNQEWWFLPCGKENDKPIYRILNSAFTKYLTDDAGIAVTENAYSGGNQEWFIENSPHAGIYYIKNHLSGKYLQLSVGNMNDGAIASTGVYTGGDNQKFRIVSLYPGPYLGDRENRPIFILPSHATHLAMDLPAGNYADNVQLQVWHQINGNKNQAFEIIWDESARAFSIFSRKDAGNKSIEIYGFSRDNGGIAVLWEKLGGENQYWYIIPVVREAGKFVIINRLSGKSLDVSGVGTANGTPIIQWDYVNGGNQKWIFNPFQ